MAHSYDTLEQVVTTARVRVNDAINGIGGNTLTDTQAFTIFMINAAWRRLQDSLAGYGCSELKEESTILSVPLVASSDPTVRTTITFVSSPALPDDLIAPLKLWERQSGGTSMTSMTQVFNGLPLVTRGTRNQLWEWRRETIVMPGASVATDIQLRYMCYLADFVPAATTAFASQNVPITRSLNPLSWFVAAEFARAREDMDAGYFDTMGENGCNQIWGRDPAQYRAINKGSDYQEMRQVTTPLDGSGPASPALPAPTAGGPQ